MGEVIWAVLENISLFGPVLRNSSTGTPPRLVEILAEVVKPDCPWGCTLVFSSSMESASINAGSSFIVDYLWDQKITRAGVRGGSEIDCDKITVGCIFLFGTRYHKHSQNEYHCERQNKAEHPSETTWNLIGKREWNILYRGSRSCSFLTRWVWFSTFDPTSLFTSLIRTFICWQDIMAHEGKNERFFDYHSISDSVDLEEEN